MFCGPVWAALEFEQTTITTLVEEGAEARVEFVFRNTGERPAVVTAVETSCGCTVAERPSEPVRPGEIGRVGVVYRPGRAVGEQRQSITVATDAGEKHELRLTIEVKARATIEPRLLLFRQGEVEPRVVKVTFGLATPVEVVGVEFSAPGFELARAAECDGTVATIWIRYIGEAASDARVVARLQTRDARGNTHVDQIYLRHRP